MNQNPVDKSEIDIIQLHPDKSLHLRGNITVTPISGPPKAPIAILPKQEIDCNRYSPVLPVGPHNIEHAAMKIAPVKLANHSISLNNMFSGSEPIRFAGNHLNEETTIIAVKGPLENKSKISLGFTSISAMPSVASTIVPCLQTKVENVSKLKKISKKDQQGSSIVSRSSINSEYRTVQYKPIAPKSEDKTSTAIPQQIVKTVKPNPNQTKNSFLAKPSYGVINQEKTSANAMASLKDMYEVVNRTKNVEDASQKSGQAPVKSKPITASSLTSISPVTGHINKQNSLVRLTAKPQGTVKMSVTNGLLGTLKSNTELCVEVKNNANKAPIKKASGNSTSTTQKSNYIKQKSNLVFKKMQQNQINRQNKTLSCIVAPTLKPLVNGKFGGLKASANSLPHKHSNKFIKVKGNQLGTQLTGANSLSNCSESNKQQKTNSTEKLLIKSGDKQTTNRLSNNNVMGNRTLLKKKSGRPSQSLSRAEESTVDTELSFTQKQTVAHEILTQLLMVTSQLPMIKFSHALETFETITDAYKLGHKINMSLIRHEESNINDVEAFDVCYESDVDKSSSKLLADTQVDGQLDVDAMRKFFDIQEATLAEMIVDDDPEDRIEVVREEPIPPILPEPQIKDEPMEEVPSRKRTSSGEIPCQHPDSKKPKID